LVNYVVATRKKESAMDDQNNLLENVERELEEITAELEDLKCKIKKGETLSLGKVKFFNGILKARKDQAGAW